MARFRIIRRYPEESFSIQSGALHEFQLSPLQGQVLEMEDVHFNHDSAVLLPGFGDCDPDAPEPERVTGIAVLAAALSHARDNPEKQLLAAGHTDTGQPGHAAASAARVPRRLDIDHRQYRLAQPQ